eukprot:TRINITY_DN56_c6_g1_i2.p1 TRINITY_DN56_c6_g1~~TRINITY_DN56_c6_g1_i2.p1  ORF type:complete len:274 (+),score=76.62 TRINITY_DN56_c6_g1_i2:456-1277(+)
MTTPTTTTATTNDLTTNIPFLFVNNNPNLNTKLSLNVNRNDYNAQAITDLNEWMIESSSQLTFHGISQLLSDLKEKELSVLFRNNHFSTILKYNGHLYSLVTDVGYTHDGDIVWEVLDQFGDSDFVSSTFDLYRPPSSTSPFVVSSSSSLDHLNSVKPLDEMNDFVLAKQLQEEQDRLLALQTDQQVNKQNNDHQIAMDLHYKLNPNIVNSDDDEDGEQEPVRPRTQPTRQQGNSGTTSSRTTQTQQAPKPINTSGRQRRQTAKHSEDDCRIL